MVESSTVLRRAGAMYVLPLFPVLRVQSQCYAGGAGGLRPALGTVTLVIRRTRAGR